MRHPPSGYCLYDYGGTDQRAKNTYPYNFCTVGSKWRWRLDDADTIFPIDNATSESNTFNPIGIPVLAVLFYLHYYRKVGAISLMLISGIIGVLVY